MSFFLKSIIFFSIFLNFISSHYCFASEIKVAVASNFSHAIKAISKQFEAQSNHRLILIYGSTGKHYAQIKNGAPYDIFLAADGKRPMLLEQENIAQPNTRFTYAIGKLVLWSSKKNYVDSNGQILKKKQFKYIAIANPKLAPYGKAAQEVLSSRNLWGSLKSHLVQGENINQTFHFITSNNAELGFVALSQIKRLNPHKNGSWWEVPQTLYKPIEQQATLLKESKAAREFIQFLKSAKGTKIIKSYGYEIP